MAVTKTHPIKSTLKAAIDYILNPEKTDGKLLASSFGCGLETADIEFAWTREAAGDRGTHLGRHLIQSFAVGETTPEEAHKIGMELAGAVLGGKYEFVLTTHVDKDHLHNHLIFNAVSFVDYKKYHSNKQSYHFIRRTSDRICKEHGLSVVVPGQDKGKSYAEYTAEKQGTSYKAKLKTAIDTLIPQVKDFDELLRRLQEMGYEIKQGKYISFRAAGQERFTRTKTLGAAYTEEAIKERIKGVYVAKTKTLREDKKIRLVVDLENSIKAQQSAGYERWAKIHNLKQAAKSMNFLTENKIEYLLISIVVLLMPLFAYVAMGATWLSTIFPSAGIGMQNNFLYQLADFNYLNIGGMSFWTPHVILLSAGIELFVFTFLAIHSYCRHQVA